MRGGTNGPIGEEDDAEALLEDDCNLASGVAALAGMGGGAAPASKLLDLLRVSEEFPISALLEAVGESGVIINWGVLELRKVEEVPTAAGNSRTGLFEGSPIDAPTLGGNGGGAPCFSFAGATTTEGGRGGGVRC